MVIHHFDDFDDDERKDQAESDHGHKNLCTSCLLPVLLPGEKHPAKEIKETFHQWHKYKNRPIFPSEYTLKTAWWRTN